MLAFSCFADDIMEIICYYIGVNGFSHLLQSGDRVLMMKVMQNVRKVDCLLPICNHFPFSLFNLPRLFDLSINVITTRHLSPLRLSGNLPLPLNPMPMLQTLSFNFGQSFSVFGSSNSSLPFSTLFPNLTNLSIKSKAGHAVDHNKLKAISDLPNLLKFKLKCPPLYVVKCSLSSVLELLPASITHLKLSSAEYHQRDDLQPLKWPPQLSKLALSIVDGIGVFSQLPPQLEDLNIQVSYAYTRETVSCAVLPSSIKRINVSSNVYFSLDGPFPPHIEDWECSIQEPILMSESELMSRFFSRITGKLDIRSVIFTVASLRYLSPRITDLNINHLVLTPEELASLPKTLVKLNVQKIKTEAHFVALPPALHRLELWDSIIQFSLETWKKRSPGLRDIICYTEAFESVECLGTLQGLRGIHLLVSSSVHLAFHQHPDWISYLPTSLENISISFSGSSICTATIYGAQFNRFTKLKYLRISINSNDAEPRNNQQDQHQQLTFISSLPRSLKGLNIPIIGPTENLDETTFHSLPHGLMEFTVFSILPQTSGNVKLSNDHFKFLPTTLTSLQIHRIDGLTPDIIDILPPCIITMILPFKDGIRLKQYYANPIWDGEKAP
jgi:hypothetical protein